MIENWDEWVLPHALNSLSLSLFLLRVRVRARAHVCVRVCARGLSRVCTHARARIIIL